LDEDFQEHTGNRRRYLGVDFVCRNFKQRLVGFDPVADLL